MKPKQSGPDHGSLILFHMALEYCTPLDRIPSNDNHSIIYLQADLCSRHCLHYASLAHDFAHRRHHATVEPRYFEPSGKAKNSSKYREFEIANSK